MPKLFTLLTFMLLFSACKKNKELFVNGEVVSKNGCFQDAYLVAIIDPDPSRHKFLRPSLLACTACFNCSNSAYIRIPDGIINIGSRIRFRYAGTDVSCLSSSEAPPHIRVSDLSKL